MLVDGRPRSDLAAFARACAYVPQDDHFPPVMTAAEVMAFRAALVLPHKVRCAALWCACEPACAWARRQAGMI